LVNAMKILAIAIAVLIPLYFIGGAILKKRPFLKKPLIILFIIAVGFILISNQFGGNDKAQSSNGIAIPVYQQNAPPKAKAPRVVQTTSRIYYVATSKDDGKFLTLYDYYFYDKNWQFTNKPLPLDKKDIINIYNR